MNPTLPIKLVSDYFGEKKTTRSTNPDTLRLYRAMCKSGDGDCVRMFDAEGVEWDLIDQGNGEELLPR